MPRNLAIWRRRSIGERAVIRCRTGALPMRPKKHETTREDDLFLGHARPDHQPGSTSWCSSPAGSTGPSSTVIAPLYSDKGRPGDREPLQDRPAAAQADLRAVRRGRVRALRHRSIPLQHFTGYEFFQHEFLHERSTSAIGGSGWATSWICCWPRACGWPTRVRCAPRISVTVDTPCSPRTTFPTGCCHRADQGLTTPSHAAWAILYPRRPASGDDGGALRPCQTVQPPPAAVAPSCASG